MRFSAQIGLEIQPSFYQGKMSQSQFYKAEAVESKTPGIFKCESVVNFCDGAQFTMTSRNHQILNPVQCKDPFLGYLLDASALCPYFGNIKITLDKYEISDSLLNVLTF